MKKKGNLIRSLSVLMLFGLGLYSDINAAPFAYIPNSGNNNVSVLDTATTPPTVVSTVLAGTNPRGVASAERTSETFTFVTNYGSNNVSVIRTYNDAITNNVVFEKVRDVAVGRNPYGIAVDPAGTFAYVTNFDDATVSKIDLSNYIVTAIPVGSNPIGIVVSPDGSKIYAVNSGGNTLCFGLFCRPLWENRTDRHFYDTSGRCHRRFLGYDHSSCLFRYHGCSDDQRFDISDERGDNRHRDV
jgi:YVTN family beta-propeller protein